MRRTGRRLWLWREDAASLKRGSKSCVFSAAMICEKRLRHQSAFALSMGMVVED